MQLVIFIPVHSHTRFDRMRVYAVFVLALFVPIVILIGRQWKTNSRFFQKEKMVVALMLLVTFSKNTLVYTIGSCFLNLISLFHYKLGGFESRYLLHRAHLPDKLVPLLASCAPVASDQDRKQIFQIFQIVIKVSQNNLSELSISTNIAAAILWFISVTFTLCVIFFKDKVDICKGTLFFIV